MVNIYIIILIVVAIISTLILSILLVFSKTRKPTIMVIFSLLFIVIVVGLVVVFLWKSPDSKKETTVYYIGLNNFDPTLQTVEINLPSGGQLTLDYNQSEVAVPMAVSQTLTAQAITEKGKVYNFKYIFNDVSVLEIYFTTGGIQTNSTFIQLPVSNQYLNPIDLYTRDMNGDFYKCITVPAGASIMPSYVGQIFSTSSKGTTGVIIPSTSTVGLLINSNSTLSLSNLPSSVQDFENNTQKDAILQSQNTWEISSQWENQGHIPAQSGVPNILIYFSQSWRLIDSKTKDPISAVYVISMGDLTSLDPIILS